MICVLVRELIWLARAGLRARRLLMEATFERDGGAEVPA